MEPTNQPPIETDERDRSTTCRMRLTESLPGIGGCTKQQPEDFEVEEIPAYEPAGVGEHLFLWIEKRGIAAEDLLRHLASVLQLGSDQIGMAGLKDRNAVTRQFVSVPRSAERHLASIDTTAIRLLETQVHSHKLRTGHLRGNRFRIVVRGVVSDAVERATAIATQIQQQGMANFFGAQRFGRDGETAQIGMQLLRGEIEQPPGPRARQRFLRKLTLSAAQALLFNRYLAQRIRERLLRTVLDGDVMFKQTGGIFFVTDQLVEQSRFDRRETIHAGPIFGKKMFPARTVAAERESRILTESGIPPLRFREFGRLLAGARRDNLVYVDDLRISPVAEGIEFSFSLPAGSYATVLLDEFMKTDDLSPS